MYLSRLHITNYRGISNLQIDDLRPINIFVGRNGAGKTSVLEALSLATRPDLDKHFKLARFRGLQYPQYREADILETIFNFNYSKPPVRFDYEYKQYDDEASKEYTVELHPLNVADANTRQIRFSDDEYTNGFKDGAVDEDDNVIGLALNITSKDGVKIEQKMLPTKDGYEVSGDEGQIDQLGSFFVEARRSMSIDETMEMLKEKFRNIQWQQRFLIQVQSILPNVQGVHLLGNGIYIDIGAEQLLPLPMMGDGFNRIFLVIVGMMASSSATVMVDEIDSGLHHSVMDEFWSTVGRIVDQGKQIFCTTHNEEMLDSLLDAFGPESDLFKIYRIDRDENSETSCVEYSPRQFDNALGFGFDVR